MIETIFLIAGLTVFDVFLFWISERPERMHWMRNPSDPAIKRLVTRSAAWVILFFIGFVLFVSLLRYL